MNTAAVKTAGIAAGAAAKAMQNAGFTIEQGQLLLAGAWAIMNVSTTDRTVFMNQLQEAKEHIIREHPELAEEGDNGR